METENKSQIQSIAKAMQLLEVMAQRGSALSLGELSRIMKWPKSTTHGILSTLVTHSMVEQSQADGRYSLGIKLFELGCAVSKSWDITAIAKAQLQQLTMSTGENAFLATINNTDTVLLDSVETQGKFRIISPPGTRSPLYCSSHGKVLLAFQPQSVYKRITKKIKFEKFTPHTIDNLDALNAACELTRQQGYYIEKGEYRMGLCSVSAPVFDYDGNVKYAIGIVGMFSDVHSFSFNVAVERVVVAARNISYEMGYRSLKDD